MLRKLRLNKLSGELIIELRVLANKNKNDVELKNIIESFKTISEPVKHAIFEEYLRRTQKTWG